MNRRCGHAGSAVRGWMCLCQPMYAQSATCTTATSVGWILTTEDGASSVSRFRDAARTLAHHLMLSELERRQHPARLPVLCNMQGNFCDAYAFHLLSVQTCWYQGLGYYRTLKTITTRLLYPCDVISHCFTVTVTTTNRHQRARRTVTLWETIATVTLWETIATRSKTLGTTLETSRAPQCLQGHRRRVRFHQPFWLALANLWAATCATR